ncbi:MAG: hypothetical protein M1839_007069 [Geoglossum umbratile]|nr:MAG: hypothetical protein M1839_007069 [Geoglossum umbratile]
MLTFFPEKVRSLGISNTTLPMLKAICSHAQIKPSIVQNHFHAKTGWDAELRKYCQDNQIAYEAFWTLTANPHLINSELVGDVASTIGVEKEVALYALIRGLSIYILNGTSQGAKMRSDLFGRLFTTVLRHRSIAPIDSILASDPVFPIFSWTIGNTAQIRAQILTILDQSRIRWSSLRVLRRRQVRKQEDDDTTIVLVVKKGNKNEVLESVEEEIYQICKSTGNAGLFVEILEGEITQFNGIEQEGRLYRWDLRLWVFAVLCHHVIRPNGLDTPNDCPEAVKPGLGHHIRVSQPSIMAQAEYVEEQYRWCETVEQEVYQLQEEVEGKPRIVKELEIVEDIPCKVCNDLQKVIDFDHHFGTVFATSGYKTSTRIGCC